MCLHHSGPNCQEIRWSFPWNFGRFYGVKSVSYMMFMMGFYGVYWITW
jgi:hypothetical protein